MLTQVRPGCRWVHTGSFDSLRCALGVFGFIPSRWVQSRAPLGVHAGSFGSSRIVEFTRVRPGVRWVHPGSLRSALGFDGFILRGLVHTGVP